MKLLAFYSKIMLAGLCTRPWEHPSPTGALGAENQMTELETITSGNSAQWNEVTCNAKVAMLCQYAENK